MDMDAHLLFTKVFAGHLRHRFHIAAFGRMYRVMDTNLLPVFLCKGPEGYIAQNHLHCQRKAQQSFPFLDSVSHGISSI